MKKRSFILLILCLLFALTACTQPEVLEPSEPVSEPETVIEPLYTRADREKQIEAVAAEYTNLLTEEAIAEAVAEHRTNVQFEVYAKDPVSASNDLHREFRERLYLRTDGSLIAPVAPETLEEAKRMIHEEFGDLVTKEYHDLVDTVLESGAAAGHQDNIPYGKAPQESFDGARRILLTQALGWIK